MVYIDGFVLAVPKKNLAKYKKMATVGGKMWIEHGALAFYECIGDDLKAKGMQSFTKTAKCKKDEVPFFSLLYTNQRHQEFLLIKKS